MSQEGESVTNKQRLEARCPWCGFGTLTVQNISSDGEHRPAPGYVLSEISCSHCTASVTVNVNAERAMLPFVALIQVLDAWHKLGEASADVQDALREYDEYLQAERGKA